MRCCVAAAATSSAAQPPPAQCAAAAGEQAVPSGSCGCCITAGYLAATQAERPEGVDACGSLLMHQLEPPILASVLAAAWQLKCCSWMADIA